MRNITVIGSGYVGLVSGTCFSEVGNHVVCCDVDQNRINSLNYGEIPIYEPGLKDMIKKNVALKRLSFTIDIDRAIKEAEIVYIAVGTPMSTTGEADLRYVTDVARTIGANLNGYKVIVNKSTVPVGTGRLIQRIINENLIDSNVPFDIVSNPEFLKEGSALNDCMNMERAVIGATSERAASMIAEIHGSFNTHIFITDLESAEMIKYAANCFLATKISFINAVSNICELVGADVTKVAEGMGMDSRIGHKFLQAGIGYGGSCFPKDTHAMVHMSESVGYDFQLMKSVIAINEQQRFIVVDKLIHIFGDLRGRTIAVLGLAFKPNTNDMRDAPSLHIITELLQLGASLRAYDPVAIDEARVHFGDRIQYNTDLYEAVMNSDACLILTEWEEIKSMDLGTVRNLLKSPVIVDGRNCFSKETMKEASFIYHSVGRSAVYN
ncbi:MAG: UDP-glucose/GDP-mannose dehydrogenase family protein [Paenibacillaceae bacterium]